MKNGKLAKDSTDNQRVVFLIEKYEKLRALEVENDDSWASGEDDDETVEIPLEAGVGGATVMQVAQRREITRSQIYGWRRVLKKKGQWSPDRGAVFLPVDLGACPEAPPQAQGIRRDPA